MDAGTVLLVAAVVTTGLVAGFLGGWAVSAVPGLRRVPDRTYVATMQSVNRAILNPLFLVAFVGAVLLPAAVTAAGNVPLNNELDRFDAAAADDAEVARMRHRYEDRWNRLHTLRSLLNLLAFGLATVAALADDAAGGA